MWSRYSNSKLLKSTLALVLGTAGGQLLVIITLPIITRLYSPEEFGEFQIVDSIGQIVMIAGAMSYDRAFVVPKDEDERSYLFIISSLIFVFSTVIGTFISMLALGKEASIYNTFHPFWIFLLIFIILLGRNVFRILSLYTMSLGYFNAASKAEVSRAAAMVFVRTALGFTHIGAMGLFLGAVAGSFSGIWGQIRLASHSIRQVFDQFDLNTLKNVAWQYRRFPVLEGPASFCGVASERIPIVIIGLLFGPAAAGIYGVAFLLANRPIDIIVQAASNVLRTKIGKEAHASEGGGLQKKTLLSIFVLWGMVIAVVIPVAICSPFLLPWILGDKWKETSLIVSALAPSIIAIMIIRPVFGALSVLGKQKIIFIGQLFMLFSSVAPIFFFAKVMNFDLLLTNISVGAFMLVTAISIVSFSMKVIIGKN